MRIEKTFAGLSCKWCHSAIPGDPHVNGNKQLQEGWKGLAEIRRGKCATNFKYTAICIEEIKGVKYEIFDIFVYIIYLLFIQYLNNIQIIIITFISINFNIMVF